MNTLEKKQTLLQLTTEEKNIRKAAMKDLLFYMGETENLNAARIDDSFLGQSWFNVDNLDYIPSQVIDNKVKTLIGKQARFMFGKAPELQLKVFDSNKKESCEQLRQFIDSILNANRFWSNCLKAFKLATVTKAVLLRLEANPGQPIKLFWHDISEFKYVLNPNNLHELDKLILVKKMDNEIWCRYTYYLQNNTCYLQKEYFSESLIKPFKIERVDTKLNKIPAWVIFNEQDIINRDGVTDIKDLKPLQIQINKKTSDLADALRFDMFTQTAITDATTDSVNKSKIAPNALMALVSLEGKKADVKKIESTFQNADAVIKFLKRMEDSMYEKLNIPRPEQLKNIPSAKTLKYVYFECVGRCSEKWHDWEPAIRSMLRLIVRSCTQFKCYKDWKPEWGDLLFNIVIKKNYPIPEDLDDAKRLAMEEVRANVRSIRSYIKDFLEDEDIDNAFKEICQDIAAIREAENEQFALNDE